MRIINIVAFCLFFTIYNGIFTISKFSGDMSRIVLLILFWISFGIWHDIQFVDRKNIKNDNN